MESTAYDSNQGFTPTLPGSEPATQETQPAPCQAPETGPLTGKPRQQVINRSCDAPIIGENGLQSRAARRAANRAKKDAEALRAQAAADDPPLSLENRSAPGVAQVTGLQTREERHKEQRRNREEDIGKGILPRGRPPEFSQEEGDDICVWVQAGGSLNGYCRKTGRAVGTVYRWMRENAVFQTLYAAAHKDRADTLAEQTLEIADKAAGHWHQQDDGTRAWVPPSIEGVAAARLQVDTRKWITSKLAAEKWGDKQTVEHVGAVSISIGIPQKPASVPLTVDEQGRIVHE